MGRTAYLVMFVSLAGCGRLGFDGFGDGDDPEPGTNQTVGVDDGSARAPFECEAVTFATANTSDVDLAVATTPTGASVFWVPSATGSLRGFDIAAADRSASPITVVRSGPYDQTSVAFVDGRLIATARNGVRAIVHDVPQPIAAGTEIANLWGDNTAKTAIVHAGPDRVMAASCSEFSLHAFDQAWSGSEDTLTRSNPDSSNHVDVTQLGARMFTAVSMDNACTYTVATDRSTGTTRSSVMPCAHARLAATTDEVAMAFETATTVDLVIDDASTVTAANAMPIALGSSPRVLRHDGRYWLSYLDEAGGLVVGYVEDGVVLTRQLGNATAAHDAYELAVLDGSPWIIGVDPTTSNVYGRRLCTPGS